MYPEALELLKRRIIKRFGEESRVMGALTLVMEELCCERGFQRMDWNDYYMHCVDVANFLFTHGIKTQEAILTALLFPLVELHPQYPLERIKAMYGKQVARHISYAYQKRDVDYRKDEAARAHAARLEYDPVAAVVKAADLVFHTRDLRDEAPNQRGQRVAVIEQYYIPIFCRMAEQYPGYESLFVEAMALIRPQCNAVWAHVRDLWKLAEYKKLCEHNKLTPDTGGLIWQTGNRPRQEWIPPEPKPEPDDSGYPLMDEFEYIDYCYCESHPDVKEEDKNEAK